MGAPGPPCPAVPGRRPRRTRRVAPAGRAGRGRSCGTAVVAVRARPLREPRACGALRLAHLPRTRLFPSDATSPAVSSSPRSGHAASERIPGLLAAFAPAYPRDLESLSSGVRAGAGLGRRPGAKLSSMEPEWPGPGPEPGRPASVCQGLPVLRPAHENCCCAGVPVGELSVSIFLTESLSENLGFASV